MARLKQTPQNDLIDDPYSLPSSSPPSSSSHPPVDTEAATQQLHKENLASASRTSNPPQPSAVLGANLLNAARKDFRHSSPPRTTYRSSDGKLSKVGLFTEPSRTNLARPRGDIWEYPTESPEKRAFRLPETVNRAPFKILKKNKKKNAQELVHNGTVEEQTSAKQSPLPSSPPHIAVEFDSPASIREQSTKDSNAHPVQTSTQVSDAEVTTRCTAVSYKNTPPEGPRYEQCHNSGTIDSDHGLRCKRHENKLGSVRCEYISDHTGEAVQCRRPGVNGTSLCASHKNKPHESASHTKQPQHHVPEVEGELGLNDSRLGSGAKRKSQEGHSDNGRPTKSIKRQKRADAKGEAEKQARASATGTKLANGPVVNSKSQIQIPMRNSHKVGSGARVTCMDQSEVITDTIEEAVPTQSTSVGQTRSNSHVADASSRRSSQSMSKRPEKSARHLKAAPATQGKGNDAAYVGHSEEPEENENDEASTHDDEAVGVREPRPSKHPNGTMEHVFEFLNLDERDGDCQTKLGAAINRVCEETSSHLQNNDTTVDEIAEEISGIQEALKGVGKVKNKRHRALKEDMYGYVFRSITFVLQSLYNCLKGLDEDFMHSLDAMRLITPFMHDILALKQTIAGWKSKVPQRYQGDKIVKDVDSYLIAPLREVEKVFSKRLGQLENKESTRRQVELMRHELDKVEEEFVRETNIEAARRERWKRWQELHITRMQCESDPRRRWHLHIIKFEELEEVDANGQKFERVSFFTDRSTPSLRWASQMAAEADWSDDQMIALLEGLERYAGPKVFHKIFRAHCRADGLLRELSVSEIVAKARWIRDNMKRLQQESGEELPAWIKQMPNLP